jgi:catechol 2,3-dioxygenase-like lactoylglutathione lyase family enzyme
MPSLGLVSLLVRDYDEAIGFYVDALGFELVEDTQLNPEKRWVVVRPRGGEAGLLLAKAATEDQAAVVGKQGGGRVFLFLRSEDFWADYESFKAAGVRFLETPREEAYGPVVVFEDLYGNRWDLLGRS